MLKNRRCLGVALLAGSIFLCFSGFAYSQVGSSQVGRVHPAISPAALGIRFGELRIHPAFSLTEQYESNVFQTPTNEQGDFSTRISPGFALHLPTGRHDFYGGYRAEFVKYATLKSQDTINHFATLGMNLDFPGGLLVNVDNVFSKSTEAPLSDVTGPVKNLQDVLRSSAEYRLAERYSIALSHTLYYINYLEQQDDFLDRVENRVGLTGFYRIFPKTDLLLEPGYGRIQYLQSSSTNRNANNYDVFAGVRSEPTARLRGLSKVGYLFREPQQVGGKSFSGVVTLNQWGYQMTDKTSWTLTFERRPFESSFTNNDFFISLFGILTMNYIFSPNLSLHANLGVGLNQYPVTATLGTQTAKRNDTLFGAGAGLTYTFTRWLKVRADYHFDRRNSNFSTFDFNDNRARISIDLAL
jgi:Putative beta-barrel porin 2